MKALELVENNRFEYKDVSDPVPAEDEVLIRVRAVGICGSDVHGMDGSTGRRIPPVVMGHEAAGDVAAVGSAVKHLAPGVRVTFDSTIYCGECFYCRRGEINFCENRRVLGVSAREYRRDGAFAEYVAVPERGVYPIPDEVSYEHAAMVEPAAIAMHAARLTPHDIGDTVVVVGTGMIGLLLIQVLRAAGYGQIIAADIDDHKLETALSLGADRVVNTRSASLEAAVSELTEGRGARSAFDAVGVGASFDAGVATVRRGGTVTVIGNLAETVHAPLQYLVTREIRVQGSNASAGEYPACLEMIRRGALSLDPLISAVAPLSEGDHWFQRLYDGSDGLLKVILEP
ncbi:MAG: galactitol-1-phosphate 5-dehydrogenase [Spirochaetaceae bacterium]